MILILNWSDKSCDINNLTCIDTFWVISKGWDCLVLESEKSFRASRSSEKVGHKNLNISSVHSEISHKDFIVVGEESIGHLIYGQDSTELLSIDGAVFRGTVKAETNSTRSFVLLYVGGPVGGAFTTYRNS